MAVAVAVAVAVGLDVAVAVAASVDVGLDPSKIETVFIHMQWQNKANGVNKNTKTELERLELLDREQLELEQLGPLLGFFWDSSGISGIIRDASGIIWDSGSTLGFRL